MQFQQPVMLIASVTSVQPDGTVMYWAPGYEPFPARPMQGDVVGVGDQRTIFADPTLDMAVDIGIALWSVL